MPILFARNFFFFQRFFFKSQVTAMDKFKIEKCEDFVWVTKDELLGYFPEQTEYLNKMIISWFGRQWGPNALCFRTRMDCLWFCFAFNTCHSLSRRNFDIPQEWSIDLIFSIGCSIPVNPRPVFQILVFFWDFKCHLL